VSAGNSRFRDVVRREWWIVVLTMVVALAIGVVASSRSTTAYVGSSSVNIASGALSRFPGLPSADQVVAATSAGAFLDAVAATTGVDVASLKANGKAYVVGRPVTRITLEFSAPDAETARKVALAMAAQTQAAALDLSAAETQRIRDLLDGTQKAMDEMGAVKLPANTWEYSDLTYKLWQVNSSLAGYRGQLSGMVGAYAASGDASAARTSAVTTAGKTLAVAGLVGLALGVALAALREGLLARQGRA
jgi:hypothetical protein